MSSDQARYCVEIGSRRHHVDLGSQTGTVMIDGRPLAATHVWLDNTDGQLLVLCDGRSYDFRIDEDGDALVLTHAGRRHRCCVIDEHRADLEQKAGLHDRHHGRAVVKSPMPGLVVKVLVEMGQSVRKGDRLIVLEAMKMENDVRAPHDGRISALHVKAGQPVEAHRELMVIESSSL